MIAGDHYRLVIAGGLILCINICRILWRLNLIRVVIYS